MEERKNELALLTNNTDRIEEIIQYSKNFLSNWSQSDNASKKELIKTLIERIVVKKNGRIEIYSAI